jgi:hypothetical protein
MSGQTDGEGGVVVCVGCGYCHVTSNVYHVGCGYCHVTSNVYHVTLDLDIKRAHDCHVTRTPEGYPTVYPEEGSVCIHSQRQPEPLSLSVWKVWFGRDRGTQD